MNLGDTYLDEIWSSDNYRTHSATFKHTPTNTLQRYQIAVILVNAKDKDERKNRHGEQYIIIVSRL